MSRKRKQNHVKGKKSTPIEPGMAQIRHVAAKDGSYARVTVEYRSINPDHEGFAKQLTDAMYSAARLHDLQRLASLRVDEIVEGEILTPDGQIVVEKWIEDPDELHMLKYRASTMEDLTRLPVYGERPDQAENRKAKAAELAALAQGSEA